MDSVPTNWVKSLLIKVGGRKGLNVLGRLADRMKSLLINVRLRLYVNLV